MIFILSNDIFHVPFELVILKNKNSYLSFYTKTERDVKGQLRCVLFTIDEMVHAQ